MKAMILAAGRGNRMGSLTDNLPKVLLPVHGKPLIHHHLHRLAAAGFEQVVINLAYHGDKIRDSVGDGSAFGLEVLYSQEPPVGTLETGGGIALALPLLGDKPFFVISGDIWTDFPLASLSLPSTSLAKIVLIDNPEHHPQGDFFYEDGIVVEQGQLRYTYGSMGIYDPQLFEGLTVGNYYRLADLIRNHIPNRIISAQYYNGNWTDIGTPQRLEIINTKSKIYL